MVAVSSIITKPETMGNLPQSTIVRIKTSTGHIRVAIKNSGVNAYPWSLDGGALPHHDEDLLSLGTIIVTWLPEKN